MADRGASVEELQLLGDWKGTDVACHYVDHSSQSRKKIMERVFPENRKDLDSSNREAAISVFGNGTYNFHGTVNVYNSPGMLPQVEFSTHPFIDNDQCNGTIAYL